MVNVLVEGRTAFPLEAFWRGARLRDQTDMSTVHRSIRMRVGFHGIVELADVSRDALALICASGWRRHNKPSSSLRELQRELKGVA